MRPGEESIGRVASWRGNLRSRARVRQNGVPDDGVRQFLFSNAAERGRVLRISPGKNQTQEKTMARRAFLTRMAQLAALPFLTVAGSLQAQAGHKQLKILMKSAWGSDDPTKAACPFSHGLALAEAG